MKKIYYSLFLLVFTFALPLQGYAENTVQEKMPSWEGTYCSKTTKNCLRIYEQSMDTLTDRGYYAQIMFFNDTSNAFIVEGELIIDDPKQANIFLLHMTRSDNEKNITIAKDLNWNNDDINNYWDSLLFGTYTRVQ